MLQRYRHHKSHRGDRRFPRPLRTCQRLCSKHKRWVPYGYCEGDKGMPKGWLYDWEGIATMGRQNPEARFGRKLACFLSVCVLAMSNRCSKDSSCAHKGLMTNWPYHSIWRGDFLTSLMWSYSLLRGSGKFVERYERVFETPMPKQCVQECFAPSWSWASLHDIHGWFKTTCEIMFNSSCRIRNQGAQDTKTASEQAP